ncbi:hypothetical protein QUA27_25365, partial [Microcoleus sp. Pol14C6]|uniref:hypothetical protein n=1 Tax=Microcoleus sp. Pol14C6 TaxID=3055399 RepID=UPI002FD5AD26
MNLDHLSQLECLGYIRAAIAQGNAEFAQHTSATALKSILSDVCSRGLADRGKVWAALSVDEHAR